MSRTMLAAAAALVAAMTLSGTPALASTPHGTRSAAPQSSGLCNWHGGTYICDDGIFGPYTFPSGQKEYWVVGSSHAVWTYWNDTNGAWHWTSLGGYADSGVSFNYFNGWTLVIEVIGSDHYTVYCKNRGDTQFSGWDTKWYVC